MGGTREPAAERHVGSVGTALEPGSGGDPDNGGRRFFSAEWGNVHEGAGIEILDVAFVKVRDSCHCVLSLGKVDTLTWLALGKTRHGTSGALELKDRIASNVLGEYAAA